MVPRWWKALWIAEAAAFSEVAREAALARQRVWRATWASESGSAWPGGWRIASSEPVAWSRKRACASRSEAHWPGSLVSSRTAVLVLVFDIWAADAS